MHSDPLESTIIGFEHIGRYYDHKNRKSVVKILPGEYYVTDQDELITTVLGSCISACIRDSKIGIGGMNHFMLPTESNFSSASDHNLITRYGNFAMEHLFNDIYKNGGKKENIEVKLFGGSRIISSMSDVGEKNIQFAKEYLQAEGYRITSEDVGTEFPRKINYFPRTGKVMVKRLRAVHKQVIIKQEVELSRNINSANIAGSIDLF